MAIPTIGVSVLNDTNKDHQILFGLYYFGRSQIEAIGKLSRLWCNFAKFIIMQTTLQHFNQYTTESPMHWPGLTSNRFPKMRFMHPRRDLISSGLDMPHDPPLSSRKHYQPSQSPQYQFRPRLRQYRDLEHWHPKPAGKRMVDTDLTQPHPRYERSHYKEPVYEHDDKSFGVRTFYNGRMRDGMKEYSLEDRMQRKVRVNQHSLRKSAFNNEALSMSQRLPQVRY